MARHDRRSPEAERYRKLYKRAHWSRVRDAQLAAKPVCEWCFKRGIITKATVCHHVDKASKESPATFYAGPFESLCAPCHDRDAQSEERMGYSTEIGVDGWPVDERHPANSQRCSKS